MSAIARALLIPVLLAASAGSASAFFEISGVFVPDEECQAFVSIKKQANPGGVVTVPGTSYNARALNREGGDHVHIDVPDANPRQRWVHIGCGDLLLRADEPGPTPDQPTARLLPFFDTTDGPDDPSPEAPALGAFDRAVLALCGEWGSHPTQAAFRAMLDEPALAGAVDEIRKALDNTVLGGRYTPEAFKDDLAQVWFQEQGFAHVFCGEPSVGNLGGLHFAGRYAEMQEKGWGGLAPDCDKAEIDPPVHTFGVRFRSPAGGFRNACPKGYALNLDASEILIEATRALKLMAPRTSGKAMCLHEVAEAGERSYLAVFAIKNGAVRTFYPEASPSCDGGGDAQSCRCAR